MFVFKPVYCVVKLIYCLIITMACTEAFCKAVCEAIVEDFLDEMLTGISDCVFEHCDGCVNQLGNQEGHECLTLSLTDAIRRYTKTVLDKK